MPNKPLAARLRKYAHSTGLLWMLLVEHRATCTMARKDCPTEVMVTESQDALMEAAVLLEGREPMSHAWKGDR